MFSSAVSATSATGDGFGVTNLVRHLSCQNIKIVLCACVIRHVHLSM